MRSDAEKAQLALDIDARRIMGLSTQLACKEFGLSVGNYYAYKNKFGGDPMIKVAPMSQKKKRATAVSVPTTNHIKIPIPDAVEAGPDEEVTIKGSPAALAKFFSSIGVK